MHEKRELFEKLQIIICKELSCFISIQKSDNSRCKNLLTCEKQRVNRMDERLMTEKDKIANKMIETSMAKIYRMGNTNDRHCC